MSWWECNLFILDSSGAIIEFVIPEKGRYTFVDHSFADAEMGAMGSFERKNHYSENNINNQME